MDDKELRNIIQNKFDDLEGTPPIGGWNRIKSQLPEGKKRRFGWILFPFAAAFIGLVFLAGYFIGKSEQQGKDISMVSSTETNSTDQNLNTQLVNEKSNNEGSDINVNTLTDSKTETQGKAQNQGNDNEAILNPPVEVEAGSSVKTEDQPLTRPVQSERNEATNETSKSVVVPVSVTSLPNEVVQNNNINSLSTREIEGNNNSYGNEEVDANDNVGDNTDGINPNSELDSKNALKTNTPDYMASVPAIPPTHSMQPFVPEQVNTNGLDEFKKHSDIFSNEPTLTVAVNESEAPKGIIENQENPLLKKPKWSLDLFGSALYSRKFVNANINDNVEIEEFVVNQGPQLEKLGFDVGFNVQRTISQRLSLFGGLEVNKISDRVEYMISEFSGDPSITVTGANSFVQTTPSIKSVKSIDVDIYNVGVNTGVQYNISQNISILSGVGATKLLMANPGEVQDAVTNINYKGFMGLSFDRKLNKNLKMRLQPMVNYYFKDAIHEEFTMKTFNYGLRLAISKN